MQKYSAEWVRQQAQEKGASWLVNHDCSLCGTDVGYIINGEQVSFRSGCGCSWSPDRPSSFEEIAEWLQMQKSDEIRDRIMAKLS
jgi:hypothetical protein